MATTGKVRLHYCLGRYLAYSANAAGGVITKIINSLNEGGVFIFSFGGTDEPGEHTDNFMGPAVYYSTLGTNGFLSLLIKLGATCKHLEYDQYLSCILI